MVLLELGKRQKDVALLEQAVVAERAALKVAQQFESTDIKIVWNNLGTALQELGQLTQDAVKLREAEDALTTALILKSKEKDPLSWEITQNNLAHAQRRLGAVTGDVAKLQEARDGFAACEDLRLEDDAPFRWARLQWNIADLALTRYRLVPDPVLLGEAKDYVTRARAFFVEGSEYQTELCDELIAQIDAAEAGS